MHCAVPKTWKNIQRIRVAASNRMQDTKPSRLRPNAARGRRQPQSNVALSCIQLENDIDILLADPNSKDLEFQRPRAAIGSKRRPTPYCIVLPGEILPGNDCLSNWAMCQQELDEQ